jgi:hypothetical protein
MEINKSPHKIKVESRIFQVDRMKPFTWADIKHLELQDDDVLLFGWEEDDDLDYKGSYVGVITRMVEETDSQFERRLANIERDAKWAKERRRESYLRLKAEFENENDK